MKPDFDYNAVPHDYTHCLNGQCLRAETCLRHQVALRIPPERGIINIVNPSHIVASGDQCEYFQTDRLRRYARGISHLLDNIPHKLAVVIKQEMISHFGQSHFYRLQRKERLFTPAQQEYIQKLFQQRGIKESPAFDEYIEQYDF